MLRARPAPLLMLLAVMGCASATPTPTGGGARPSLPDEVSFTAVVRLPAPDPQGGKVFRGVLLEGGGATWVASYERDALWAAFEGRQVDVTGMRYVPKDQALVAPHIHVTNLSLVHSDETAQITRFDPEITLDGQFVEFVWPQDSKLAGEKMLRFRSSEGREFFLGGTHATSPGVPLGRSVSVRGRIFEPSPYAARPYGEYLWVYDVTPR